MILIFVQSYHLFLASIWRLKFPLLSDNDWAPSREVLSSEITREEIPPTQGQMHNYSLQRYTCCNYVQKMQESTLQSTTSNYQIKARSPDSRVLSENSTEAQMGRKRRNGSVIVDTTAFRPTAYTIYGFLYDG